MSSENPIRPIIRANELHAIVSEVGEAVFKRMSDRERACHQSCITCTKFQEAEEMCLHYQARPPARVIAYGCPAYNDIDEVPF